MCLCAKFLQSYLTLCESDAMDYNPADSSVMEYSSQEYWSVLPCPPPVDLPDPRMEPVSVKFPELAGGFFTTSAFWEARQSDYKNELK